ncbi:MAG TPA: TonB family protein [Candidatus Udaeobacter sp.]|nr:TonB family protein [Candidatus Udaeobacter sp.]
MSRSTNGFGSGMTQDPKVQADMKEGMQLGDQDSSGNATALLSEPPSLAQVAQTLAAHGGGALSADLALDLVLNDLVKQARNATGATGAAIALFRDGELTCRATSGENAPDLGVRVDATSGLAGACVSTGEIQQCRDTEIDTRVNADTCRLLGVRSMLMAPLVDGQKLIGVIQVFSAWPNAFGKREFSALQVLAGRIAESNREAEAGLSAPVENSELQSVAEEIKTEPIQSEAILEPVQAEEGEEVFARETEPRQGFDLWGTVLVVLVIATAVALGLVIGWRRAAEFTKTGAHARTSVSAKASPNTETIPATSQNAAAPDSSAAPEGTGTASITKTPTAGRVAPTGGLIVTENGKVVYRSPSGAGQAPASDQAERSLIHRVEPQYPAEAKARHVQGPVVLDVQVLGDGAVGTVAVVSGDPLLTQSAIDAVKQWRYQPESSNGQAIESQARVTVKFTLPHS